MLGGGSMLISEVEGCFMDQEFGTGISGTGFS